MGGANLHEYLSDVLAAQSHSICWPLNIDVRMKSTNNVHRTLTVNNFDNSDFSSEGSGYSAVF